MTVGSSDFVKALLDPDLAVPDGLTDPKGRPAGKRFAVYRNNVAVSLTEALETAYPVVRKLVGQDFFRAMAGVYLRQNPPTTALMMVYGFRFPGFLDGFAPVAQIGYLPDVARLERALRQSYHAADAPPVDAARLQALPPDRLMTSRLTLAPSLRLVRSAWPIHALWRANTEADAPKPVMRPEDVLVLRPGYDPAPHLLGPGAAAFIEALGRHETFAAALDAAGEDLDLTACLGLLLDGKAITAISEGE